MFFEALGGQEQTRLPKKVSGIIRFDLIRGEQVEHWYVTMRDGGIAVSRAESGADCVVHLRSDLFERVANGEASIISAMVRTECVVEGQVPLLMMFRRIFPDVRAAADPRQFWRESGGSA
jgi:putative sterol carrier protein